MMPNWCDNSVRLTHEDKSKIDALEIELKKWNDTNFQDGAQVFNHLRPRPADQEENWYDWNINNWGSKWDASIIDWDREDDNNIHVYFDSAWSPPVTLYEYLTEQGWQVNAIYHECGMAYIGQYTSIDGDDYYEYDITDEESIENLPEDLIEFADLRTAHQDWKESEEQQ
jgi:hypothetical protein